MSGAMSLSAIAVALKRGRCRRPSGCGTGTPFPGYVGIRNRCDACSKAFHHHRAESATAYWTMLVAGSALVRAVWFTTALPRTSLESHSLAWPLPRIAAFLLLRRRCKCVLPSLRSISAMLVLEKGREPLQTCREGMR